MNTAILWEQLDELFQMRQCEAIKELLVSNDTIAKKKNELMVAYYLVPVYEQEKADGKRTVFEKVTSIDDLYKRYKILKFYFWRIEYDILDDGMEEFCQFLKQNQVSAQELFSVMYCCVIRKEKVMGIIKEKMITGEIEL